MEKALILVGFLMSFSLVSSSCRAQVDNLADHTALLAFKAHLKLAPNHVLSGNWSSKASFCDWIGVSCTTSLEPRVLTLQIKDMGLGGNISPHIANLSHLVLIDLSHNDLEGPLPSDLGHLDHLRVLNLSRNNLEGSVPPSLSHCKDLQALDLGDNIFKGGIPQEVGVLRNLRILRLNDNNFTGTIPSSIGNISKLERFLVHENNLEGTIPREIGNLFSLKLISFRDNDFTGAIPTSIFNTSSLEIMDLSINGLSGHLPIDTGLWLPKLRQLFLDSNQLSGQIPVYLSNSSKLTHLFFTQNGLQGRIPQELGNLHDMQWLEFESNELTGNIPSSIFNLSSLRILKSRHNNLQGKVPVDLGVWLPNLEEIFLSHNQFTGQIPPSISNASKITSLEVSNNSFSGPIPMTLGHLTHLQHLNLQSNLLVNGPRSTHLDFINSLESCRKLKYLILATNPLNGILPDSVGNLSTELRVIDASFCEIKGSIPSALGNLSSLIYLGLNSNDLEETIPTSILGLQNLERLLLTENKIKGPIPVEVCNLGRLGELYLGQNMLSGTIPTFIENLTELRMLSLAANILSSAIPLSLWRIKNLQGLNLSQNSLDGFIPPQVGNLKASLYAMDLSSNNLSGGVPDALGDLQNLLYLDLSKNSFRGPIPKSFSRLIVIQSMDLSSNALSGTIPESLESLRDLKYLNVSFNRLEGRIPHEGGFANLSYRSFMGNLQLCGVPELKVPICPTDSSKPHNKKRHLVLKITIPITAIIVLSVICFSIWIAFHKKKMEVTTGSDARPLTGFRIFTYHELRIATDNFSEANLLGVGSSSSVYRGTLSDRTDTAIKVFNLQWEGALKNFGTECEVLSNVQHRNLVRIVSACSSPDFKALVLEFMPNGSLDEWLYSHNNYLSLLNRLDIITDVASAIEYLHHEYSVSVPIVHCDLKPSNVLLDKNMIAHVGDFGIAKLLAQDHPTEQTKTLGTIGYISPEYGLDGVVSTSSDVYSYGIVLLETFTRKRPTDDMFKGEFSLHKWVNGFFPDEVMEVVDINLLRELGLERKSSRGHGYEQPSAIESLFMSIIEVGLQCSRDSPKDRINMKDVVVRLKKIKMSLDRFYNK